MSPRNQQKSLRAKKPLVLVFAENEHDSRSIRVLLPYLNERLASDVDIQVRRDPPSLTRNARPDARRNWLGRVASVVKADAANRRVHAVLVHQDSDGPDPGEQTAAALTKALRSHIPDTDIRVAGIVPIQELEAWWLLFPDAVRAIRPQAWRSAKFPTSGNTATITNPKEKLVSLTAKVAKKHPYQESDSEGIAQQISKQRLSPTGSNPSWDSFERLAKSL